MSEKQLVEMNPGGYDQRFRNRIECARHNADPRFDVEFKSMFIVAVPLNLPSGEQLYIDPYWITPELNVHEINWDATLEMATYILWILLNIDFQCDLLLTHEEFDELYRTVKKNQLSHLADELVFQLVQRNRLHLALEFGLEKAVMPVYAPLVLDKCGGMPVHLVRKHRRHNRPMSCFELICFHMRAYYMRMQDFIAPTESPFGKENLKIFCLSNGGQYLNVDRKLFLRASPVFAEMIKENKKSKYFILPIEYKVLRWCMRIVHQPSGSFRPYSHRMIDSMFHVAHEYQMQTVIEELLPTIIEEDLLYLTWNYKHREATRAIYEKYGFYKLSRVIHSEKFRMKKYTVPALDFAALWDMKVKEDQADMERIARRESPIITNSVRCGHCPYCALADLPSYRFPAPLASPSP